MPASVLQAVCTVNGVLPPPVPGPGNASFQISEVNSPGLNVAPYGAFWRATNFDGFQNPDGSALVEGQANANVFDPSQRHITFIWDMGDDPYTPAFTPNIPTAWRDWNRHYGKQIVHTYDQPGTYTMWCMAFDTRGNYAYAEFERTVADPDVVFPANKTVYVSQSGNFPDPLPAGSVTATTGAQINSAMQAMGDSAPRRVRLPFGETLTNMTTINRGGGVAILIDCWGNPANGPATISNTGMPGPLDFGGSIPQGAIVRDIILQGSYVPARDIGFASSPFIGENSRNADRMLFHRCKFTGWENSTSGPRTGNTLPTRIYSNTQITDFFNYGIGPDTLPDWWSFVGCDLSHHVDTLNSNANTNGDQQTGGFIMGPQHGPLRTEVGYNTYVAMTSFFSRAGWFGATEGTTLQPAIDQACVRFWHNFNSAELSASRQFVLHHHNWNRVTFEGGDAIVSLSNSSLPAAERPRNFVLDKFIMVGSASSYEFMLSGIQSGVTAKNGLMLRYGGPRSVTNLFAGAISFGYNSNTALPRNEYYNITYVELMATGDIRTPYVQIALPSDAPGAVEQNNVLLTPSRSIGEAVSNLSTTTLEGFVLREKGRKWNFPPIGNQNYAQQVPGSVLEGGRYVLPASALREGGAGAVADGEWIRVPYPDYTGFCRGAGFPVTRALVLANATQYHRVSVRAVGRKRMAPASAGFGADGFVDFDFPEGEDYFRVRNLSGTTWPNSNLSAIQISLDLSDYFMDFWAETAPPATTIPEYRVLSSSAGFQTGATGLRAFDDGFLTRRPGSLTNEGATISGTASRGWLEPVA